MYFKNYQENFDINTEGPQTNLLNNSTDGTEIGPIDGATGFTGGATGLTGGFTDFISTCNSGVIIDSGKYILYINSSCDPSGPLPNNFFSEDIFNPEYKSEVTKVEEIIQEITDDIDDKINMLIEENNPQENDPVNQILPTANVVNPVTSLNLPEEVASQITEKPSPKPLVKKPFENIIAFFILFVLLYICLDSIGFI